jgi:D,D-heptose 1,7-bisphosphate phosphatase
MKQRAVFLDRDGTINEDPGYIGDPGIVKLLPGAGNALAKMKNKLGFRLIVVSNQSGVARGLITERDVVAVNNRINELLKESGAEIDRFYFCPFHPDFNTKEECGCRKPSPKMILQGIEDFDIVPECSYMIGDSVSDIKSGKAAGLKTILVKTGYGKDHISALQIDNILPNFVACNLEEAYYYIKKDFNGEN